MSAEQRSAGSADGESGQGASSTPGRAAGSRRRQGPASVGSSKTQIDVRALVRMLEWSLEINDRQRQFLQSALEVLDGGKDEA